MSYLVSIGLETHVQLRTRSKIWCGCRNVYGSPPNTDVCPICLGYPGTMPVLNAEAVRLTVRAGLMLGCRINGFSKWDRKNYFYPDMPKNYQISQYDLPLCEEGALDFTVDGEARRVRITRIHLEEDVGKSIHEGDASLLDFNRAGTPLMEIVTEPDLTTPDETLAYLQALKQILLYGEVSDGNLEEGNIRCDINCSVRPAGQAALGVKTEIKNMNTFRGVHRALAYEIERQVHEVEQGGAIRQETRRWDDEAGITTAMRSKEYAHDYRYFPEPDLVPVVLGAEQLAAWRDELPERPAERRARFMEAYGLPEYDAGVLVADKAVADYYEAAARLSRHPKAVSNWVMTEMLRALSEAGLSIAESKVTPEALAELVQLVQDATINSNSAKEVFNELFAKGGRAPEVVERKGLVQVSDTDALDALAAEAIAAHAPSVADYRKGKKAALQFLVGQVMKLSRGKANPQLAAAALRKQLDADAG